MISESFLQFIIRIFMNLELYIEGYSIYKGKSRNNA